MPVATGWPAGPARRFMGWHLLRAMARDPLGCLAQWRDTWGDLVHLPIWPEHVIVVNHPGLVRDLLVGHHDRLIRAERAIAVFAQLHGHSVLIAEGEAWRRRRQALVPALSPREVQAFTPALTQAVSEALDAWPQQPGVWPAETALTRLTMEVITQMVFSTRAQHDAPALEAAMHDVTVAANAELYWLWSLPDWMPHKWRKARALRTLRGYIHRQVSARSVQPPQAQPDDLLGRLLSLHRSDPAGWPLSAVEDECTTAFLAGHETVAATLAWWCACLAAYPEARVAAAREVDRVLGARAPTAADLPQLVYLTATLQETMRLYPAAPLLFNRRCTQPVDLGGHQFPAGTLFMIPVHALHHDPRWFAQPADFRPERHLDGSGSAPRGSWMPFGTGARVCLGQHLAMSEMLVATALILQRYTFDLPGGAGLPPPRLHISLRPQTPLALRLSPREPAGTAAGRSATAASGC
ncbi:MAG: cytochrome P450 [Ramlibacter sp.]|nr:cytochrome P450 [Ramlibacter sp.]